MATLTQNDARIVVRHQMNGKTQVLIDGRRLPGLIDFEIRQEVGSRAELHLNVVGLGFRVEQERPGLAASGMVEI